MKHRSRVERQEKDEAEKNKLMASNKMDEVGKGREHHTHTMDEVGHSPIQANSRGVEISGTCMFRALVSSVVGFQTCFVSI